MMNIRTLFQRCPVELALIACLSIPIFFYGLGDYSIVNGDEAFYRYVARRMVETGEWGTIQFNNEVRLYDTFLNAPLHYWMRAVIIMIFGDSHWSMRILSASFGFFTVLLVYFFTRSVLDRLTAFLASLILLTTWQFIYWHSARTGEMETIIAFFFLLAIVFFLNGLQNGWWFLLHHLCLVILMNLKLPLVIIPCLAETVFFLFHPQYRRAAFKWILGAAAVLPFGLSWHFCC